MFAFKKTLFVLSSLTIFLTSVVARDVYVGARDFGMMRRDDGASGDGGCDPCEESCTSSGKRELVNVPRMLNGNDTSPWDDDETMRWRKVETVDAVSRAVLIAYNLEFDCSKINEVCNNMCYGVYCKNQKQEWSLTVQRDSVPKCQAARKKNACGSSNPNYCSAKKGFTAGYSCDEFPFASTKEGQTITNVATRCVPKGQNSSQGGTISGFYKNGQGTGRLADGTTFTIVLDNTGSATNCGGYGGVGTKNCNKGTSTSGKTQL
ncbi:hypothetical protein EW146_g2260 [Bondarzewia mesenterica]|uniref:Deoxyribonuclease NucA/NucB domain-containing protein n=1 Tax=Bondarzewia mesenterica TaxID=1095465 RepID=A0A4S4M2M2_9AGAM|nr:hypothetical protein EW146_g2260 [Bondarzewia mesenterica]